MWTAVLYPAPFPTTSRIPGLPLRRASDSLQRCARRPVKIILCQTTSGLPPSWSQWERVPCGPATQRSSSCCCAGRSTCPPPPLSPRTCCTSQPSPSRHGHAHGGSNSSEILCAYKAYLNGVPLAAGPSHPTGPNSANEHPAVLYDSIFSRPPCCVPAVTCLPCKASTGPSNKSRSRVQIHKTATTAVAC